MKKYFQEVEDKLIEETNYHLELTRGAEIADSCAHIENVVFPKYYKELSAEKVLVMD